MQPHQCSLDRLWIKQPKLRNKSAAFECNFLLPVLDCVAEWVKQQRTKTPNRKKRWKVPSNALFYVQFSGQKSKWNSAECNKKQVITVEMCINRVCLSFCCKWFNSSSALYCVVKCGGVVRTVLSDFTYLLAYWIIIVIGSLFVQAAGKWRLLFCFPILN